MSRQRKLPTKRITAYVTLGRADAVEAYFINPLNPEKTKYGSWTNVINEAIDLWLERQQQSEEVL